jgi:hypothetical protein
MRERILGFVRRLRARGLEISPLEARDGLEAVAAAGVEREVLREALAAALVKDEDDRGVFDAVFEETFPLAGPGEGPERRRRRGRIPGGAPAGAGSGPGEGGARPAPRPPERPGERGGGREPAAEPRGARGAPEAAAPAAGEAAGRAARRRRLLTLPFREFTARDVAEARDLVRELGRRLRGRLGRRLRRGRRGQLDFRRTIRSAMSTGGVPARPQLRTRRPGRPDLVALCDLSGSVAAASELLLGLIAPAADYFRRVHLFAYVDRLVAVSIEDGHVAPAGRLDLHARSDFGRVLDDLWQSERALLGRGTLVLVLGDARNNRRPPRVDLLRAVGERVKAIVWLVPEPRARWDTGDSVIGLYAPACAEVVECLDLAALVRAVRRVF